MKKGILLVAPPSSDIYKSPSRPLVKKERTRAHHAHALPVFTIADHRYDGNAGARSTMACRRRNNFHTILDCRSLSHSLHLEFTPIGGTSRLDYPNVCARAPGHASR